MISNHLSITALKAYSIANMSSEESSIIYFVRHGECMGNISRRNLSPDEAVLTENGKLQATLLGKQLEDVKFTLAYTSDYPRTLETAQMVLNKSNASSNLELKKDIRLREKYLGETFENGAKISDFLAGLIASKKDFLEYSGEGGESCGDVEGRIEKFLQELFSTIDNLPTAQTVLVVTHGAVLLHLWHYLLNAKTKYNLNKWKPEYYKVARNTGYYIVEVQKRPEAPAPRELNIVAALCSEHLKSMEADTLKKYAKEDKTANPFEGCIQQ